MTDAAATREHAIALMREALALLKKTNHAQAASHLQSAISAALSVPRQADGTAHDRR